MDWDAIAELQIEGDSPYLHKSNALPVTIEQKKQAIVSDFERFVSFLLCSSSVEILLSSPDHLGVIIPVTSNPEVAANDLFRTSYQLDDKGCSVRSNGRLYHLWYTYIADDCRLAIDTITKEYVCSERFKALVSSMDKVQNVSINECCFSKNHLLLKLF